MTDEQFEIYNRLLELTVRMLRDMPEDKRREYEQQRDEILRYQK